MSLPDKAQILKSIAALAKRLGRTPTLFEFVSTIGISRHAVLRFFPKWNDAVRAARLRTSTLFIRLTDTELLKDWGQTVRNKGGLLSRRAYLLFGKYEPRTLEERFGSWSSLPEAFRKFASGKREWADVLSLLPRNSKQKTAANVSVSRHAGGVQTHAFRHSTGAVSRQDVQHSQFKNRPVYGNAIDFRVLRYEPVNEQGVVLLFGMLAKELGYLVERVQYGFPDCEALRRVAPDRWQRVLIEFEFESRNFRDHGHPPNGCDVIVCWCHNWPDCPPHLEVLELSCVINSRAASSN